MLKRYLPVLLLPLLAACYDSEPAPADGTTTRPMDEVPDQELLENGQRQFGFDNGCEIVLEAERAVVVREKEVCELYQRDIALLYAAGD
ncbi:hypothetical protein [Algicella marina]|uniref:Uncharacterized protein n=1 Tax=Algicella marina TaxID=2683284 RepID=A0A6P1SYB2_9RHOB|nr:hypothetical protein [Algicella marina]QHQ34737.1 hypothetical protein GO499_05785 [Algicella marina]